MRRILTLLSASVLFVLGTASIATESEPEVVAAEPTVRVQLREGFGSGFSIGNGYFVTAAHVVRGEVSAKIETIDGQTIYARVVMLNMLDDVAILHSLGKIDIEAADLDCRDPIVGEEIQVRGNPAGMAFLSAWGRVAGEARSLGPWRSAWIANITVLPGNSGGPVFDLYGGVIGVAVGMMAMGGAPTQYATIVSSTAVCRLRDIVETI